MYPELFRVPLLGFPVYGYGLMLVLGLVVAMQVAKYLARRDRVTPGGIDPEFFVNAALMALIGGLIGARLSHVLENWSIYADPTRSAWANLRAALNFRGGGLTFYGGFLFAMPLLVGYAVWRRVPVRRAADVVAVSLMIGLGFGRIGCLLNGCCYGATCELPIAITYPYGSIPYQDDFARGRIDPPPGLVRVDPVNGTPRLIDAAVAMNDPRLASAARAERSAPVHPTQVYSVITAFLVAGACAAFFLTQGRPGRGFALMLMLEGPGRFLIESVRVNPPVLGPLSYSQTIAIGLTVGGVLLWFGLPATPDGGVRRPDPLDTADGAATVKASGAIGAVG